MMKPIRLGTRGSALALWQTHHVQGLIEDLGYQTEVVEIKTEGDLVLDTPLHMMGGKGVFTKALDVALLNKEIDLAVHSLKDVPTELPLGLCIACVLEREDPRDVIVFRQDGAFMEDLNGEGLIATSSPRRLSQWKYRYAKHRNADIRGNVQTRLNKLKNSDWNGAIFAAAGLKRLEMEQHIGAYLDWMIPAPGQGAVAVMVREEDLVNRDLLEELHHEETALCTQLERDFLNRLNGGCSAPVGAHATIADGEVQLEAFVFHLDGTEKIGGSYSAPLASAQKLGIQAAEEALANGAEEWVKSFKKYS